MNGKTCPGKQAPAKMYVDRKIKTQLVNQNPTERTAPEIRLVKKIILQQKCPNSNRVSDTQQKDEPQKAGSLRLSYNRKSKTQTQTAEKKKQQKDLLQSTFIWKSSKYERVFSRGCEIRHTASYQPGHPTP